MRVWKIAGLGFFLALPPMGAAAEPMGEGALCPLTDDASNCVRILACIGKQGRWFHGRAFGRGAGTLAGEIDDGTLCTGSWTERTRIGAGQADVQCDDGMKVRVLFYYQEPYTGTAIGRGLTNRGQVVQSWSGLHVLDYLEAETGKVTTLPCLPEGVPIS